MPGQKAAGAPGLRKHRCQRQNPGRRSADAQGAGTPQHCDPESDGGRAWTTGKPSYDPQVFALKTRGFHRVSCLGLMRTNVQFDGTMEDSVEEERQGCPGQCRRLR